MFGKYLSFIEGTPDTSLLYIGQYNPVLVLASIVIAIFAAYTALVVAGLSEQAKEKRSQLTLLVFGGITLGVGVWAMHFIGMLGFSIPCGVTYDPWITGFSMLPGIFAGIFSLYWINRGNKSKYMLLVGGIVFGSGIGVMHYSGMAAMRMSAFLRYDPVLFLVSIVVAVVLAVLALWIRFGFIQLFPGFKNHALLVASLVMGGAVSGMHYTAMAAGYFLVGDVTNAPEVGIDPTDLALRITGVTVFLIGIVLLYAYSQISWQTKHANDQLLEANNTLKFLKIALDEHAIVSVTDVKGNIIYGNEKFCEISKYEHHELIGQNHRILKSDEHPEEFFREMWRTIANGHVWHGELKNRTKDGNYYWVTSTIVPFLDERGKPYQYISIRTDISRIKETEAQLQSAKEQAEEAAKAKSNFLATMSHEIRTPMNGVLGMLHLLKETALDEKQQRYVRTASNSSELLLSVINDILDFSKLDAQKLELESIAFNPVLLVEETAAMLASGAQQKGLEVICSIAPEVPSLIEGDPTRLRQILTNLTSNAIKFTETGHVELYANYFNGRLQFGVADTGIGLTDEQQAKIFDPFIQADGSHTRKYGGTGLGLAICSRLVNAMHGKLEVTSRPGVGSDFHFEFHVEQPSDCNLLSEQRPNHDCPLPLSSSFSGKRILIADDYAQTRLVLERMLRSWGVIQIGLAEDGDTCLAQYREAIVTGQPYDIVLLDLDMRSSTATELMQVLRRHAGATELFIIGLNSLVGNEKISGLDALVNKPVSQSDLFDSLLCVLGEGVTSPTGDDAQGQQNWWFGGRHLLLVEDNPINQEVAHEILSNAGFDVEIRENGQEAVVAVQEGAYDVVLMDIQMPVMDGLTATRNIRALGDAYANLPILAMTAHAMVGEREKSLEAGMQGHITKPINLQALFSEIANWVPQSERPSTQPVMEQAITEDKLLPELPGINMTEALERLAGNRQSYARILRNYRDRNRDVVKRIAADIHDEALDRAAHLAHSLKGSSGNIGAMQVHQCATKVEQFCRDDAPAQALEKLDELQARLDEVLSGLDKLPKAADKAISIQPGSGIKRNKLRSSLVQLDAYLDHDLRKASSYLGEIRQMVASTEYSPSLDELEEALNSFDIDAAKTVIRLIGQKL